MTIFSELRFYSQTRISETGCWIWQGSTVGRGYGKVGFRGKTARAHRVSWIVTNGEIPDGLWVLHKCDNPACIRPDHLFLGTADDNNKDMAQKKRSALGNKNGHALHPESYPTGDRHYSRTQPERLARGSKHGNAKLTEEAVRQMRRQFANGETTVEELAAKFNVSKGPIYSVINRTTWKHVED